MYDEFGSDEKGVDELSVKRLDEICDDYFTKRAKVEELKGVLSEATQEMDKVEALLIEILQDMDKDSWSSPSGKVSLVERSSYKQPISMEKKLELFDYLKSKGVFHELVSINSNTLNAWTKSEVDFMRINGVEDWLPPGLSEPSKSYYLRKGK